MIFQLDVLLMNEMTWSIFELVIFHIIVLKRYALVQFFR